MNIHQNKMSDHIWFMYKIFFNFIEQPHLNQVFSVQIAINGCILLLFESLAWLKSWDNFLFQFYCLSGFMRAVNVLVRMPFCIWNSI